jgi:hypothetical protein
MIPQRAEISALSATLHEERSDKKDGEGPLGTMTAIRHAVQLSHMSVQVKDAEAPIGLDRHEPVWLPIV